MKIEVTLRASNGKAICSWTLETDGGPESIEGIGEVNAALENMIHRWAPACVGLVFRVMNHST